MVENAQKYIIGHLDWPSRVRFALGLAVAIGILGSIGFSVLRPWDPFGAISLALTDGSAFVLVRITAVLLAAAVLASILMDGRLKQFGTFAACIGLLYPVVKTAGMEYVMVRLQAGEEFEGPPGLRVMWVSMTLEMLAWTVPLLIMLIGSAVAERWVKDDFEDGLVKGMIKGKDRPQSFLARGIVAMVITAAVAAVLVGLLAQSTQKGQVIFAVAAAFFVGPLVADQVLRNDEPVWNVLAVPLVALIVYGYTSANPERPAGLEGILHLPPNHLAGILPVEYLSAGVAATIFGFWTTERMRHSKEHE